MYFVYKVEFKKYNAIYVGCTNNIRRRKDQHNENARKGKSFFGKFLKASGIVLKEENFIIIKEFFTRPEALSFEREITISLNETDMLVLNDNYSNHCSRIGMKGKNNPFSKVYAVIDMHLHIVETVDDMHAWCDEHPQTSYKTLIGTSKRKPYVHCNRYIAREINEWNSLNENEKKDLISGKWYADHLERNRIKHIEDASRTYIVRTPDGEEIEVTNLDKFAHERGINDGNLHASLKSGKSAHGYKVIKRLS